MMTTRPRALLFAASVAFMAGCYDGQTYPFDASGSYTGNGVFSVGSPSNASDAGPGGGSVTPMPAATVSFDGGSSFTLWPGCSVSITRTGTESTEDQHDTPVKKANGSNFQVTDTHDQAYDYTLAPNQPCAVGPADDDQMYVIGNGSMRFTVDGAVSANLGGTRAGAPFTYTFEGNHS